MPVFIKLFSFLLAVPRISPWAFWLQYKDQEPGACRGNFWRFCLFCLFVFVSLPMEWLVYAMVSLSTRDLTRSLPSYWCPRLISAPSPGRRQLRVFAHCLAQHVGGWGQGTCLWELWVLASAVVQVKPHVSPCDVRCSALGSWKAVIKLLIRRIKAKEKVQSGSWFGHNSCPTEDGHLPQEF